MEKENKAAERVDCDAQEREEERKKREEEAIREMAGEPEKKEE